MDYRLKVSYITEEGKKRSLSIKNIKSDVKPEDARNLATYLKDKKLIGNEEKTISIVDSISHIGTVVNDIPLI